MSKAEDAQRKPDAVGDQSQELAQARQLMGRLVGTINAEKPTKAQLAELRQYMTEAPALVAELGDLSRSLRSRIIEQMTAHRPGMRMVLEAQLEAMAAELGIAQASPLERMLIDQVLIAWLRWQSVEWTYQTQFEGSISLTMALYLEKRLTMAHRRYLRAIESLARVRRLLKRAPVQINIAQQQVVANG